MTSRAPRATYCEIPKLLQHCKPFHGNSMFAVGSPDDVEGYRVMVFCSPVACVTRAPNGRLIRGITNEATTKTTRRAINLAKRNLPGLESQ